MVWHINPVEYFCLTKKFEIKASGIIIITIKIIIIIIVAIIIIKSYKIHTLSTLRFSSVSITVIFNDVLKNKIIFLYIQRETNHHVVKDLEKFLNMFIPWLPLIQCSPIQYGWVMSERIILTFESKGIILAVAEFFFFTFLRME